MKRRPITVAITLAVLVLVGSIAVTQWDRVRLRRDFDSIVYSSRDGLCSIASSGNVAPYCPRIFLEDPVFSPNGKLIAAGRHIRGVDSNGSLYPNIVVVSRRGLVVQSLAKSEEFVRPIWTPDGNHILAVKYDLRDAVGRWKWPAGDKTILPIDGLDSSCRFVQAVSLSPSGRQAAFLCDFNRIYVADVGQDRFRIRQALALPFSYLSIPHWVDEGALFAVARIGPGTPASLWQISTQSNAIQAIPTPGLDLRDYVAVSPDRGSVVVTAAQRGAPAWSLWRIDLADARPARLTHGDEDTAPTWSAD